MKKILLLLAAVPVIAFSQQLQMMQHSNRNFSAGPDYTAFFEEAYQSNPDIPRGVLEAVSYTNTHLYHLTHNPGDAESCMGLPKAYGVMGLVLDGKNYFNNNLAYVSNLSGVSANLIINDPKKNILAFAKAYNAVMTISATQKSLSAKDIDIIAGTFTALSELPHQDAGQTFALNTQLYSYFTFLNNAEFQAKYNFPAYNFDLPSYFGEDNYKVLSSAQVTVSDEKITDSNGNTYKSMGGGIPPSVQSADYASAIWNPAASCNYSSRTAAVTAVVIHDVEGSYAGCISWFQNCSAAVSAHYVVRSSDGQITQMVLESKKAWHVGSENGYTIGIEHEGYQAQTGWYTPALYQSSANLVKDICNSGYGINPTTCWSGVSCSGSCVLSSIYKIKGHQHYPNQTHDDPGPHWNWQTYYNLINNTSSSCGTPSGLTAGSVTSNSAVLSWSAVSGAASYNIQYKPSTSSSWTTVTSTALSQSLSGLTASTIYQFQVQAVCSSTGSYSSAASFTTTASSSGCGTPAGLSSGSITSNSAVLSWSVVSGALSYNVQYKSLSSSSWTTATTTAVSQSISGLSASTAYQFQVQAVCSSAGPYSSVAAFTTSAPSSTSSTVTIGTATTPYSAHPFGSSNSDERVEYIIKNSELAASGWSSSSPYLKSIAFNVSNAATAQPLGNFTITIAHTSAALFAGTSFLTGTDASVVYSGTYTTTSGWNTFNFNTPFAYNGTSNLLITICWNNSSFSANSSVFANSYADFMALYYRANVTNGGVCSQVTGTQSYYRPNAKLAFSSSSSIETFDGGNGQQRSLIDPSSSSTANGSQPEFTVFPNPFDGNLLNGKFSDVANKQMTIQIYDLLGRQVFAKEIAVEGGSFSLSLGEGNLKSGVYLFVGTTDGNRFTKRVVVKEISKN